MFNKPTTGAYPSRAPWYIDDDWEVTKSDKRTSLQRDGNNYGNTSFIAQALGLGITY
jgi:hypothetical protein